MPFQIIRNDITKVEADAIVNTANPIVTYAGAVDRWIDGQHGEAEALRSCYRNSLRIALQLECESIAFPLIATGAYGFPKDKALHDKWRHLW